MLTPEELLKPRAKAIAPYPGMRHNVGDIFFEYKWDTGNSIYVTNADNILAGNHINPNIIKEYPHLFKPLAWYEEREEKDMPRYVKWLTYNAIVKLSEISFYFNVSRREFLPATKAEYLTYINKQQPATM